MRRSIAVLCAAALPALAAAQGARDASRFFDSGVFELQDNYEMEGRVGSVDEQNDRITITREDAPAATLSVAPDTRVEVNGGEATLADIEAGAEIHATFNLARQTPLAIEIEVDAIDVAGEVYGYDYYDGYHDPYFGPHGGYYDAEPLGE
jgi:hypothetical protein